MHCSKIPTCLNHNYEMMSSIALLRLVLFLVVAAPEETTAYSNFLGKSLSHRQPAFNVATLTMRKQKASDRRTRRLQRGLLDKEEELNMETMTKSPMQSSQWCHKQSTTLVESQVKAGGRSRSRKRSTLYNSLSSYHSHFLNLLTAEYKAEVSVCRFYSSNWQSKASFFY